MAYIEHPQGAKWEGKAMGSNAMGEGSLALL